MNKILELKNTINEIHKDKLDAYQIRARLDRLQYMDKPSKYFYDLEKIRGKSKNIDELKSKEGTILTRKEDILNEIENFYTKLYDREPTDKHQDKIYQLIKEKKIPQTETIGNLITPKEVKTALNQMQNNKSPGADGLPKEFYITFWSELKEDICEMLNNIFLKKSLSNSQKQAIIKLLYKKGDPKELEAREPT